MIHYKNIGHQFTACHVLVGLTPKRGTTPWAVNVTCGDCKKAIGG